MVQAYTWHCQVLPSKNSQNSFPGSGVFGTRRPTTPKDAAVKDSQHPSGGICCGKTIAGFFAGYDKSKYFGFAKIEHANKSPSDALLMPAHEYP
jgi:hypothetical protein